MALTSKIIKEQAYELGFVLAGIARAEPVDAQTIDWMSGYLKDQRFAGMSYLARNVEKRLDVTKLVEGAKSVICCAVSYNNIAVEESEDMLYVARYARFEDYHESLRQRLKKLVDAIEQYSDKRLFTRVFVDTAPLLEKYYASKAGLGWLGKNTLMLNKEYGSRLLLGEIVIDVDLDYDEPPEGSCGECDLCLQACPGQALLEGGKLDSTNCLSYHTIESKDTIPVSLSVKLGKRVFGCDSCQDVCPYNSDAKLNTDPEFMERFIGIAKSELVNMTEAEFNSRFGDTPISRAGLEKLRATAK